jgi:RNA polymerase sigma-70 factor (ECF subfamily)
LDLTGSHHDAEDLAQDVFLQAFRAFGQFRGEAAVQTWLRRIAINTYLNKRRKKALSFMRFFGDFGEREWEEEDLIHPDREAAGQVARQHIEEALERLSPRERSAFVLRFYQELSLKEVAEAMTCAEGTVKSLLHRAIKKLQKALAFYRTELGL